MPRRSWRLDADAAAEQIRNGTTALHRELEISRGFPDGVLAEARRCAESPRLPGRDRTEIPFVTIDPPGSRDLDQALHLERAGEGYVVHYAIADVAAFVRPDGPLDAEVRRRGETLYGVDDRVPLHPRPLGAGVLPAAGRAAAGPALDDRARLLRGGDVGPGGACSGAQPRPADLRGGAGRP